LPTGRLVIRWQDRSRGYAPAVPEWLRVMLALVLLAGLLGGCADAKVDEANAYVGAVNRAQQAFATTSERLQAEIRPGDAPSKARKNLARYYAAVDRFVAKLRAIDPPARVRVMHASLIAAMVRFGVGLRAAGADITSQNASRVLDGQQSLAVATAAVQHAINSSVAAINGALKG